MSHAATAQEAMDMAERSWHGAAEAVVRATNAERDTAVVKGQLKAIIGLLLAISTLLAGVFGWLVIRVDAQAATARESAKIVSEQTVLAADRKMDERMKDIARDAAREALRLRDEQIDTLSGKAP